ncbi:MAG TPA: hypothetical protein VK623_01090 [Flavobacterium sp.]|nr:hypothetical protein [Flavobacterium sp.]
MENKNEIEDAAAMKNEWQQRHETAQNIRSEKLDSHPREDGPDTEKYLEIEQPGVSFTHESHPTMNSDYVETSDSASDRWKTNGDNSRNADAFSQDDYILRDNIDLDEDQNESISSDDI